MKDINIFQLNKEIITARNIISGGGAMRLQEIGSGNNSVCYGYKNIAIASNNKPSQDALLALVQLKIKSREAIKTNAHYAAVLDVLPVMDIRGGLTALYSFMPRISGADLCFNNLGLRGIEKKIDGILDIGSKGIETYIYDSKRLFDCGIVSADNHYKNVKLTKNGIYYLDMEPINDKFAPNIWHDLTICNSVRGLLENAHENIDKHLRSKFSECASSRVPCIYTKMLNQCEKTADKIGAGPITHKQLERLKIKI